MMEKKGMKKRGESGESAGRSSQGSASRSIDTTSRASSSTSLTSSQATLQAQSAEFNAQDLAAITGGYDLRAHLRQLLTFSDDDQDDSSEDDFSLESYDEEEGENDADEELQKLMANDRGAAGQPSTPKPTDQNNSQALVPITEELDVDSEEEREIMKEIKNEITNNVRQEMKSELELYKAKMDKLNREAGSKGEGESKEAQHSDLDQLEPKLREAIIKMRKLDKILMKRIRREKEVKRDRIILERRIRRELEGLHHEGKEEYKEVKTNEQKFLALELPARHNEETSLSLYDPDRAAAMFVVNQSENVEHELHDTNTEHQIEAETSIGEENDTGTPSLHSKLNESNAIEEEDIGRINALMVMNKEIKDDARESGNFTDTGNIDVVSPNGSNFHLDLTGLHRPGKAECWTNTTEILGVTIPDEFTGEEVFATQLNEDEYPGLHSKRGNKVKSRKGKGGSSRPEGDDGGSSQADEEESRGDDSSVASGSVRGKHNKKDFIKRNKKLAADAGNVIAMTDEEKKRLDDLLLDVDAIPEVPEGPGLLDDNNPFQLAVKAGEGFVPENDELRTLTSIDSRLKDLMPPEDYQSIASSSMSHVPKYKLFTHTGVKHAVNWENHGERALFQNAEQRELNERMSAIDNELAHIHNRTEDELDSPRLGEDQLQDLIEQCVTSLSLTSMSRLTLNSDSRTSFADTESVVSHATTIDSTPRSPRSARQEILDNPPRLAPDVLQKLLAEAYHPLSKQLTTLQEEQDDEEEGTPIPADVWKLISMEKVQQNGITEDTGDMDQEQISARNGSFSALSRSSTASSLASVSDLGRESRKSQVVKLPEIDPSGTMVTQGLYNQQPVIGQRPDSSSTARTPVNFVSDSYSDSRMSNNYTDSRMEIMSIDGDIMSPHPPPRKEKRERNSGGKSRTVTPASRASVT